MYYSMNYQMYFEMGFDFNIFIIFYVLLCYWKNSNAYMYM